MTRNTAHVRVGLCAVFIGLAFIATGATLAIAEGAPPCDSTGGPKLCFFSLEIEEGDAIASLKGIKKPQDPQLTVGGAFIRDQAALVQLGKAFFWDQQAGSDGQSCGSCHF